MVEITRIADGYKFSNRDLLERALTHSSAIPELRGAGADSAGDASAPTDNERLEFLGDAVLELLVSESLLETFPDWSEGQLSKSRSRIVNASSLEEAARRLRLGEHLRLGRGEEKTGGRCKPALLADAYEALIAAVWGEDGRENIATLRVFIGKLRRKLEADPHRPRMLITEPGLGYRLAAPSTPQKAV